MVTAAGFGQFAPIAALGDVAEAFGEVGDREEATLAERAGLSGTVLGGGLAVIRLASLATLALAGLADRVGRRVTVLAFCMVGLALVAVASLSPEYWVFVLILALSRPLLTATVTVATVAAAEQTSTADRAKAVTLVAAGVGVGSGLVAVVRGAAGGALGFRGAFALALVPLVAVAWGGRRITEPDRFLAAAATEAKPLPVLGAVSRRFRGRVAVLAVIAFAVAVVTGPANSFLFVYAENVLGLAPAATGAMVIGAGVSGLVGLLLGRWAADMVGRRVTAAAALVALSAAGMVTYSDSVPAVVAGYLLAVLAGSVFAPALGALQAELFPTSVRGAVAGWIVAAGVLGAATGLLAFGAVADVGDRFDVAAVVVFSPAAFAGLLLALLPETRGRELEELEDAHDATV